MMDFIDSEKRCAYNSCTYNCCVRIFFEPLLAHGILSRYSAGNILPVYRSGSTADEKTGGIRVI